MMRPRRSLEEGHKRKFLVVIDDTPECLIALSYAARRAQHTNGAVVLLYVIEPEAPQSFLGVEDIMRAEAREQAQTTLAKFAVRVRDLVNLDPEMVIREGKRRRRSSQPDRIGRGHRHPGAGGGRYVRGAGAAGDGDRCTRSGNFSGPDHHRPRAP